MSGRCMRPKLSGSESSARLLTKSSKRSSVTPILIWSFSLHALLLLFARSGSMLDYISLWSCSAVCSEVVNMETVLFDEVRLCLRCWRRTWEETPSVQSLQPISAVASRTWTDAAGTKPLWEPESPPARTTTEPHLPLPTGLTSLELQGNSGWAAAAGSLSTVFTWRRRNQFLL